jgi:hypothetical protein
MILLVVHGGSSSRLRGCKTNASTSGFDPTGKNDAFKPQWLQPFAVKTRQKIAGFEA